MEGNHTSQFFLQPKQTFQRQYEALRAIFVDAQPLDQVAVQLADLQYSDSDRCAVGRTGEILFEGRQGLAARLVEGLRHLLGLT